MAHFHSLNPSPGRIILLFLLACCLLGASLAPSELSTASWMDGLPDSTPLHQLSIPGTHDSGADRGCPGPFFDRYVKCQDWGIRKQLDEGIRYLDIRCRRNGAHFQIYHGQCNQGKTFDQVLADCEAFLQANPSEVLLMRIKEEHRPAPGSLPFDEVFESYREKYLQNKWHLSPELPLLGEVRGGIVLLDNAGLDQGIPWSYLNLQDEYALRDFDQKWELVRAHLDLANSNPSQNLFLNHCTATAFKARTLRMLGAVMGLVKSPRGFANNILPRLETYLQQQQNGRFGVVVMDFPTAEAIRLLIQSNAHLEPQD